MKNVYRETRKGGINFFMSRNPDFPPHVHEEIELVYVKRGDGTAFCDGKRYDLSKNDFFIAFPNQVHSYSGFEAGEYLVLILMPSQLFRYSSIFMCGHPRSAVFKDVDADATYLFDAAYREFRAEGASGVLRAELTAFFGKLVKYCEMEKSRLPSDGVFKILEYCGEHYREAITVEDVARAVGFSRSHVSHIFGERLNISFCEYINSLRLNDAEQLLRLGNYTVTEISDIAGFPTIRTFNRVFRTTHGVSPSEYRKRQRDG